MYSGTYQAPIIEEAAYSGTSLLGLVVVPDQRGRCPCFRCSFIYQYMFVLILSGHGGIPIREVPLYMYLHVHVRICTTGYDY